MLEERLSAIIVDGNRKTIRKLWYSDALALRLSGLLGFGTELFLLMICSINNTLEVYFYLNLFLMNGILFISIAYRRFLPVPAVFMCGHYLTYEPKENNLRTMYFIQF